MVVVVPLPTQVTVLDSHIEVQTGWLEPLMARIAGDSSRVVMPVIDGARMLHVVRRGERKSFLLPTPTAFSCSQFCVSVSQPRGRAWDLQT
jgi:hypothetical protein